MRIDDDLLIQLKELAARENTNLQTLVNRLLRRSLAPPALNEDFRLSLDGWDAELQPGVDLLDRDRLFDFMDGR